jgi:hypothetical protein
MKKALVVLAAAAMVAGSALTGPADARDRSYRVEIRTDRGETTANQIINQYNARTARIKADLRLTPEQEKNWGGFDSAMREIAKTNADRLVAIRAERTQQKGPTNFIDQMRMEAKYLSERSAERKKLADAAEPLYASLDDRQKQRFARELARLGGGPDFD